MGYMDFDVITGSATIARTRGAPDTPALAEGRFSPLEWSVVALSRGDPVSSLRSPGRVAIAMGNVFGMRQTPRLACPRLEALRRIAVLSWQRGFAVPGHEVTAFTTAGFTLDQYEVLVASISRTRAASSRRTRR